MASVCDILRDSLLLSETPALQQLLLTSPSLLSAGLSARPSFTPALQYHPKKMFVGRVLTLGSKLCSLPWECPGGSVKLLAQRGPLWGAQLGLHETAPTLHLIGDPPTLPCLLPVCPNLPTTTPPPPPSIQVSGFPDYLAALWTFSWPLGDPLLIAVGENILSLAA